MTKLTPEACRAARALLSWGVRELQAAAQVSPNTVTALEAGKTVRQETADKIVAAFDAAGVEILNGNAPGARFKPRGQA